MPDTPIQVVLTDETDAANGFAYVLPLNTITIYCAVPEAFGSLGDYDDFLSLLFIHELTHIVHLDTIGGVARSLNEILGKQFAPNHVQPRWFVEGIAVYAESKATTGGRVRSSLIDMYVRAQILADRFWRLDEITTQTRRFPGGSIAWEIGGRFLDFIARRYGESAVSAISREYGSRFIPYGINIVARHATGKDYPALWAEWQREEEEKTLEFLLELERRGVVRGAKLPFDSSELYHPHFGPRGELTFVASPRDGDTELVFLDRDLRTVRRRLRTSNGTGAFTPDGAIYVASAADVVERVFNYSDLELIDVATGARRQRTYGARADQPDVSPDGERIVAVQQHASETWISTLSVLGEDQPERLYQPPPGHQVSSPRWSPDGKSIAFSLHTPDGGRRISILELASRRRRDLTASRAQDIDPVFSPDGATIYFGSDRGDVFNIYAVDVATRAISKITDVPTGAFEPAIDPSGRVLAFVYGTDEGYELRLLDLEKAERRAPDPHPIRAVHTATAAVASYPDERYAPWETLLPRTYLPTQGVDGLGETFGVTFDGQDSVGVHTYAANIEYGLVSERINYAMHYTNRMLWTPVSLSSSLVATARSSSFPASIPALDRPESIFRLRVNVDFPLGRFDGGYGFGMSYGIETRRGFAPLPNDPIVEAPPPAAADLFLASFAVSWRFSNVRYHKDSVSAAAGHAVDIGLDIHDPRIGSDFRLFSITAHWSGYFQLPWLEHHVLALRASLGGSAGDARGRAAYALGGLAARNILRDAVDQIRVGADVIRGYDIAAFRGNAFYLGTIEYRVPVWTIEHGFETLPFFVDRLHGAVFTDAGDTPGDFAVLSNTKVGAGAELRLDLTIGYYLPLTARFGYARGFSERGIDNIYLVLGGVY